MTSPTTHVSQTIRHMLSKVYSCNFANYRTVHKELSIPMLPSSIAALKQQSPFSNARYIYYNGDHQFRLLRGKSITSLVIGFQNKLLNNTKNIAKLYRTQCDHHQKTQPYELAAKLVHWQYLTDTENVKRKCMLQIHNLLIHELKYDTRCEFDKIDLSRILFLNELAVGFPCKPDDCHVKIIFNVATLNLKDFRLHLGPSLLSTFFKYHWSVSRTEWQKSSDTFSPKEVGDFFARYKSRFGEMQRALKTAKRLLTYLIVKNKLPNDQRFPQIMPSLRMAAQKRASMMQKLMFCNVCGDSKLPNKSKNTNIQWLFCKKHGYTHWCCSPYASCCCPMGCT